MAANAFALTYQRRAMHEFRDHTVSPLTMEDVSPHMRLAPHYIRPNVRVHTGNLDKIAMHGMIRDERHMHQIQKHATALGKHMGDRMMGYHA